MRDTRPPRIDLERAKRGPTAEDLEAMPPTTAADWADAWESFPVDQDIFDEAVRKQQERNAEKARQAGGSAPPPAGAPPSGAAPRARRR